MTEILNVYKTFNLSYWNQTMIKIEVKPYEDIEKAIRRFKKRCEREDLPRDIKKASVYEKPGDAKRRKKKRAIRNKAKEER